MAYRSDSDFDVKVGATPTSIKAYVLNPKVKRNISGHMSSADFHVDYQVTPSLNYNDEIKFDFGYVGSLTNKFYGLITDIKELEDKKLLVTCKDFSKYFFERDFTEVYLNQTDVYIVKALLDEYCSDLTYDSNSIPDTNTVTIAEFGYENAYLIEGFEELCERAKKDLWTEGKKVFYKRRASVDSGYTIQRGVNAKSIAIVRDEHMMCNRVVIVGARRIFHTQQKFSGDGSTTEFTLTYKPHDTEIYVDGVLKKGGIENVSTNVDYYVDYDQKKIKFVTAPGAGADNIVIDYNYSVPTKVEAELDDSISQYGPRFKKIENRNLTTRSEAKDFALAYIQKYGLPLKLGEVNTIGTDGFNIGEKVTLVDSDKSIDEKMVAIELVYSYSKKGGYVIGAKFTEEPPNFTSSIKELVERIKKLEAAVIGAGDIITKILSSNQSFIIKIKSWTVKTRGVGNTFILGTTDNGLLNDINMLGETTLESWTVQQSGS